MLTDKQTMKFEKFGEAAVASGDGWEYERFGSSVIFSQHKKLPSLRVVKSIIKQLEKSC